MLQMRLLLAFALAVHMAQVRPEPTRVETVRATNTTHSPSPRPSAARARGVSADDSSDVDLATLAARIFERHGLARYDKVSEQRSPNSILVVRESAMMSLSHARV